MKNEYIPALITGALPVDSGVYKCSPDEAISWRMGSNAVDVELLWLEKGATFSVGYSLNGAGQAQPLRLCNAVADDDLVPRVESTLANVLEMARAGKVPGVSSLERWIHHVVKGFPVRPDVNLAETAPGRARARLSFPRPDIRADKTDAISLLTMPVRADGELPIQAVLDAASEMDAAAHAVAARVGYQLPADSANPDLIMRDISANMRRSVEAVLEIGRALLVLKELCAHGTFGKRLENLAIERGVAARFMSAARKFANVPSSAHLLPRIGSQTKLFELLVLDDGDLEELAETGQTGNLQLDEIDCMSVSELRRKLRERDAQIAAKDAVARKLNNEVFDLRDKIARREQETPPDADPDSDPDAAEAMLDAIRDVKDAALTAQGEIVHVGKMLRDFRESFPGTLAEQTVIATLREIIGAARQVAENLHVMVDASPESVDPDQDEAEFWRNLDQGGVMGSGNDDTEVGDADGN
jgi:hypothetical protein